MTAEIGHFIFGFFKESIPMDLSISLTAEKVFSLFGQAITNSIFTGWLVSIFILACGFLIGRSLKKVPNNGQSVVEMIFDFFYTNAINIVGREDVVNEMFPVIITLFFYIIFSNWSGLLPGFGGSIGLHEIHQGKAILSPLFRAPTSDLNTTIALAILAIGYIQYLGVKYAGPMAYMKRFLNFSSPIAFFVGIVEFISESMRVISFGFRLFGNVFAGEVLIAVILYLTMTLVPYVTILPIPFFFLELFVGIVQAFIFCFLTLVFTSLAIVSHDAHGHQHGGEEALLSASAAEGKQN
jgi:F-type H+-transporting ATPase subunit a